MEIAEFPVSYVGLTSGMAWSVVVCKCNAMQNVDLYSTLSPKPLMR